MDAALSFDDLDAIEFQIRQAMKKVKKIEKKLKGADPADKALKTRLETEMNQAKDKILEAESNKDNLLRNKKDLVAWRKIRKEGEYLRKYHGNIIKRRTEEKVTFYLHATNHILFGVTILNTMILALGSIKSNWRTEKEQLLNLWLLQCYVNTCFCISMKAQIYLIP